MTVDAHLCESHANHILKHVQPNAKTIGVSDSSKCDVKTCKSNGWRILRLSAFPCIARELAHVNEA